MSRRKAKKKSSARNRQDARKTSSASLVERPAGRESTESTDSDREATAPGPLPSRVLLLFLFGIAGAWWLALVVLAVTVANPVTLNRRQIDEADYIVTATASVDDVGVFTVVKEWKRDEPLTAIEIENIDETNAAPGQMYLLPLSKARGDGYRVTETRLPGQVPLVYPATEATLEQLSQLLERKNSP